MRLLPQPLGLGLRSIEPLAGPRSIGAGSSTSIGNFTQTFAAAFGLRRYRFNFAGMHGQKFRRFKGWITAQHGGANATRWSFFDPDKLTAKEAGLEDPNGLVLWAEGQAWSNGLGWQWSMPHVRVAAPTAFDDSEVVLMNEHWGHRLDLGDEIGFFPFHFGVYTVTEVIEPGRYRVWPPLRKEVTTADYATLDPSLVMRMEGESAAAVSRGLYEGENLSITLVEVPDYDVRDYFTG